MPRNDKRNTKEEILSVALKLFSERGYGGVGVRDIAKEIGIRESALYKHFGSKRDIFDTILKDIESRYQQTTALFKLPESMSQYALGEGEPREELFRICLTMFEFYLKTEYGSQLRRMLTIEQYQNTEAGHYYRDLIINNGLEHICGVFTTLIQDGIYADADPVIMSLQFYGPLYLLLCQFDNRPNQYEEALSFLERHMTQFDQLYARRTQ